MMKIWKPKPHLFEVKRQSEYWQVVDITLLIKTDERIEYVIYSANRFLQVGEVFWATLRQTEKGLHLEHVNATHLETCFSLPAYAEEKKPSES